MDADDGELWQMLVYWSETAGGNPTGVVFAPPAPPEREQELAAILGFRDTAFLSRAGDVWLPRMYSPAGPLEFCTQTLLAAREMLRLKGLLGDNGVARFRIGADVV